MSRRSIARSSTIVAIAIFVAILALVIWRVTIRRPREATPSANAIGQPATNITSLPGTTATSVPATPHDYMSLVLATHPDFPTTQPLAMPLDRLADSARLVFDRPILLDEAGDLWITHRDARSVAQLLREWKDDAQVHLTRDRVAFAYRTFDETGRVQPQVVVASSSGVFELLNRDGRIELGTAGRAYRWDRAFWLKRAKDEMLVVPTDTGVSILRPQARPMELFHELIPATPSTSPATQPARYEPQVLLDNRGLIAWAPWDVNRRGSRGAARFVDGKWSVLDRAAGWAEPIVHIVPLLDGSALVVALAEDGLAMVTMTILDTAEEIDPAAIKGLVEKLANPDPRIREGAHDELTRYGPGIWPMLEKLRGDQPPEAQLRIGQLLRAKVEPTLGRMTLLEGPVKVVARFRDGGALLFAEAGVGTPATDPSDAPNVTAPAWIAIRPGRPIELASPFLVSDLNPDTADISGFSDEWIVTDEVNGPQRFLGNHLEPLLRKDERVFRRVVGTDRRGRWLFRKEPSDGKTLVIDPTLPDATPRLPVWHYPVEGGTVGWTLEGWPVIKRGGAWVLDRDGTRPMNESTEMMFNDLREMPSVHLPPTMTAPSTGPTTTTTTSAPTTSDSHGPALWIDNDGGRYFGGQSELRYVSRDGREIVWTLPPDAAGAGEPKLIEAEGRLFLFNEVGRVLRIRRTPGVAEPFVLEATFVKNIPNVDSPTRVWLDPAGRIVIAYEGNRLTLLFPSGRIPRAIAQRMLAGDLKANEPE
jgi:hypothetical protein